MTTKEFERLFNNFLGKPEFKKVNYSDLTREEKIFHLLSVMEIDTTSIEIFTEKETEICKMSKDLRFQLIEEATRKQNFDLITKLATGVGFANVVCSLTFKKCSTSAQLNYLETEYKKRVGFGRLPEIVEVSILGGDNFRKFIEFCADKLNK